MNEESLYALNIPFISQVLVSLPQCKRSPEFHSMHLKFTKQYLELLRSTHLYTYNFIITCTNNMLYSYESPRRPLYSQLPLTEMQVSLADGTWSRAVVASLRVTAFYASGTACRR